MRFITTDMSRMGTAREKGSRRGAGCSMKRGDSAARDSKGSVPRGSQVQRGLKTPRERGRGRHPWAAGREMCISPARRGKEPGPEGLNQHGCFLEGIRVNNKMCWREKTFSACPGDLCQVW